MIDKIAAFFGLKEETSPVALIVGPLFLILAIVLIPKIPTVFNYDLLFIAILGLFLTAKWKVRGCIAALLLLAFSAGGKHVLFPANHAWQAGLESSIGMALLISSLVFEESSKRAFLRQNEIERNEKTILFLEEDLNQQKTVAVKESAAAVEKLGGLRLQLEESESQISTLHVLNDVLRKAAAKSIEEKEAASAQGRTFGRREGLLLEEIDSLQTELNRLGNESVLVLQNKQLFNELNESRSSEAQTSLINETLVRLHAKENQKVREFEGKFSEVDQRIQQAQLDKINAERAVEGMQSECQTLRDEIERLQQAPRVTAEEKETLLSQLQAHQMRFDQYRQVELLYRQLKVQFEEKNEILHQTRSQLFRTDTELQAVQHKLHEKELTSDPIIREIHLEIDAMEEENSILQQENQELQNLVSHLMERDEASSEVKKKIKKSMISSPDQASLF